MKFGIVWCRLLCLVVFLAGCAELSTPTPEQRVERGASDIERAVKKINQIIVDLQKAKKIATSELSLIEEAIQKAEATRPNTHPQPPTPPQPPPTPKPEPSPAPTPATGPPVPGPAPSPTPSEPVDGRFEIAKAVYRIGSAVESPDRVAESQALAGVFESVASQIAAGTLNGTLLDPQWHKISMALTSGNKPIIAKHLVAWNGPAEQLSEAIASRYSDGKLNNNQDWSDLLNEIASGLKAVK